MAHPDAVPAKTIVVAVDGSPVSREAGRFAVEMARTLGARLHIIHVLDAAAPTPTPLGTGVAWTAALPGLQDAAREIVGLTKREAENARVPHTVRIVEGYDTAAWIVREAREERADLIVMGSHGRRGLRRAILGSVAESVLRAADRPVLVFRRPTQVRERKAAANRGSLPATALG